MSSLVYDKIKENMLKVDNEFELTEQLINCIKILSQELDSAIEEISLQRHRIDDLTQTLDEHIGGKI